MTPLKFETSKFLIFSFIKYTLSSCAFVDIFSNSKLFSKSRFFVLVIFDNLNSHTILFQYFLVYLVEIIIISIHINMNATTLETASSIPYHIS
ncbi:MAG: hypothetical protein Q8S84_02235 [bacterium]|nr:hypothetical protein [bacterium]MDP3380371.1 hypothetical protein [bacterium]